MNFPTARMIRSDSLLSSKKLPNIQDHCEGEWVTCNEETLRRFSAAGYFFGKKLHQELNNIPIALIQSAWSGTPVELWEPNEVLDSDPATKEAATKIRDVAYRPNKPGYIYNSMIYPISNYTIAGVIWYQGEGNTVRASTYEKMFTGMIGAWRKQFEQDFPFYYVQIAPFADYTSAYLREQQTKTLSVLKTGMVVTSDLVDNIMDIHPQMKKEVGVRLANYALAETYGKNKAAYKGPTYKEMKAEKNKIRISFNNAESGLMIKAGKTPTDFYIAGDDKNFIPATAKIEGNTVVVWSKDIKNPTAVRFGFTNTAMPNLFSKDGLPVNLFRTDDWDVKITEPK